MASFPYLTGIAALVGASDWGSNDIRGLLVMTNTTTDTEDDKATLDAFTTLDEFDGLNYVRIAFTGEVINVDSVNNRVELDASDTVFGTTLLPLGAGTRDIQGLVIFRHITNNSDSIPLFYIDLTPSFAPSSSVLTIEWNAEGIVQFA